ncbi:MAG: IMP dehydrogenase [Nanoarchaeota archaeon]|nr:IMP dehydrogenase [Nanoarchaeota archaeon]
MGANKKIDLEEALTFNDVLILPRHSDVEPDEPDISSYLAGDIKLNKPFIGSPMEDVSGEEFCIAMAQHGAFAFLHRNLTPEEQAMAVERVKKHEGYIIWDPVVVTPNMKIGDILSMKEERELKFDSFPVVEDGKLVGILTHTDYYLERPDTKVKERMTTDVATIKLTDSLDREKVRDILRQEKKKRLLVVDDEGHLRGLITGKDFVLREMYNDATRDNEGRLRVGAAIGVGDKEIKRAERLYKKGVDAIVIDVSHGDSKNEIETIKRLRKIYGNDIIIGGGNVATSEGAYNLIDAGVDFLRVGIGPGSICTTRVVLGAGVPQITAILECAEAAKEYNVKVIADGGIKEFGDIAKALAAGADTVMMGGMFAGVEESPGRKVLIDGRLYKVYKGMGSEAAMLNRAGGGLSRYNEKDVKRIIPQGVEGIVDYKGPLEDLLYQMEGALKRSFAIVGARNIYEFHERATLKRVTQNGAIESHPSVRMTEQPKNYFGR